jgi:hypothetical protein
MLIASFFFVQYVSEPLTSRLTSPISSSNPTEILSAVTGMAAYVYADSNAG